MLIANRLSAPRYKRDRIEPFLLVSQLNSKYESISITLVEMQANGIQKPHKHIAEQAYYIVNGTGLVQMGNEKRQLSSGDLRVYPIKYGAHINIENGSLTYISACSPGFSQKQCKEIMASCSY